MNVSYVILFTEYSSMEDYTEYEVVASKLVDRPERVVMIDTRIFPIMWLMHIMYGALVQSTYYMHNEK